MQTASDTLHFSTKEIPQKHRLAMVREVFGRTIIRFDLEPLPNGEFGVDSKLRALPGLGVVVGSNRGISHRTREMLQDASDDVLLCMNVSAKISAQQRGRTFMIEPGEAFIGSCAQKLTFWQDTKGQSIGLRLPRATVSNLVPDIDDRIAQKISQHDPLLRLLASYVPALDTPDFSGEKASRIAVSHIHDLVGLTIGASRDAGVAASRRGLTAARILAIKKDIITLIGPQEISADILAARHGITPRYVRMLFENDGESLWSYVLDQRLRRAYTMLIAPAHSNLAISAIAFEVGFGDLSYFNRTFRRRFCMSPSDARHGRSRQ
jgi:AraC-like DNA-binding protein